MKLAFKKKPKVDPTEYDVHQKQSQQPTEAQVFFYNENEFEEFAKFKLLEKPSFP